MPLPESLVSVVTPVYNGAKHIGECIESVLAQTYQNWEYVIVNNCSTDRTLEIAQAYAKEDTRIRVHNNEQFLEIIPNWNHALRQMSPESKYCKVVHGDDWLFPECIGSMAAVAEKNPTVGIVGSYVLRGRWVKGVGLPYPSTVVPGREVCHATFRRDYYVFGSPSSILMRCDLIRKRKNFYNEQNFHADLEACFDVLQESDFGFVHQVLSHTRMHDEAQTATVAEIYETNILGYLAVLSKYGLIYCSEKEYQEYVRYALNWYYDILARNLLRWREKAFWDYQRKGLAKTGFHFSLWRVPAAAFLILMNLALNPKATLEKIARRVLKRKPPRKGKYR